MEVNHPNKETTTVHPNSFIYNNSSAPQQPEDLDLPHQQIYASDPNSNPSPSPSPSPSSSLSPKAEMIRYRECQKNHAAHLGSQVVDGCGEFMPSGEEGTPLALKCAACDCHRNFHRREVEGETTTTTTTNNTAAAAAAPVLPLPALAPSASNTTNCYISFSKYHKNLVPVRPNIPTHHQHGHPRAPVMMEFGGGGVAAESSSDDLNGFRGGNMGCGGQFLHQYGLSKKRFRTKFSEEQKEKMMEFAEKIGWKIQKQDDVEVQRFCSEVGVKRQVFKVWMHNNKQAMKKKPADD